MPGSVERNIYLYPLYRSAADAMAWLPVFFLYFSERLTLPEVLLLEAVYYLAVVAIEVPSGYLSDVAGRRKTLILACIALIAAYLFFLFSDKFLGLAIGQFFLAVGIAARSGTDTSLHYESLKAVGRDNEFGDREAQAGKYKFAATAIAALAGGLLGSINLALPYWLSLATACLATYFAFSFVEPAVNKTGREQDKEPAIGKQLKACVAYLENPFLKWLLFYSVFIYSIVHIPYEFYQPYLALLETAGLLGGASATLIAGVLFALTAFVASITSAYSMDWQRKLGLLPLLTWAAVVELLIIAAMAIALHPLIAACVILRSGPMASITAPINAAKAPLIENSHRATYLSLESLLKRLLFATTLFGFSYLVPNSEATNWQSLSTILRVSAVAGIIGLGLLLMLAKRMKVSAH